MTDLLIRVLAVNEGFTLTDVLDIVEERVDGGTLSVNDVLMLFRYRGYGPLLLVPALIVVLPTGAIPGVPTICGLVTALIAAQIMAGQPVPWLPKRLREAAIRRESFDKAYRRCRPFTRQIDRLLKPRLQAWVRPPFPRVIAALCLVLALAMIPLELIPFAAAVPAWSIAFLALGITGNDGLWVATGLMVTVLGSIGLLVYLLTVVMPA